MRGAGAALESGASFYITEVFDLTLDLVVGGLHHGWRCLHGETRNMSSVVRES
jgi:hypothetical protein